MPLDPAIYLVAPMIVLLAYTVYAVCGFGSTMIAVSLLAHVLPIKYVVPLVVLLDFAGSLSLGTQFRSSIDRSEVKWLIAPILAGVVTGTALLLRSPSQALAAALGVLVAVYGIYTVMQPAPSARAPRWSGLLAGFTGGTMSASVGAGG